MRTRPSWFNALAIAGVATLLATASASAQAWHYPELQPPDISTRDFAVLVAGGGDYGTSAVGQWREGIAPDAHVAVDVGFATPGSTTLFLAGASVGYGLMKSTAETPIDLILTGGIYGAFGNGSEIRIPVGVVAGHHFPLADNLVLTPYVAPRLSVDICASDCAGDGTHLKLNFDIGASLDVTRSIGIRSALTIGGIGGGPSQTAIGIGVVYRPNTAPRH